MGRRVGIVVTVLLLANLVFSAWPAPTRGMGPEDVARTPVEWPVVAAQLKSHPHYQRVQAEIAAVAPRNEDELISALDSEWVVFWSGVTDGASIQLELDFQRVLADRNIRRLDDLLGRYSDAERRERIEQLGQLAIRRQIALVEEAVATLDNPPPVYQDNSEIPKPRPISGRRIAVCGMMFLAAKYCGTEAVDRMLKQVVDYSATLPARLEAKPYATDDIKSAVPEAYLPEKAFVLDILIYAAEQDKAIDQEKRRALNEQVEIARQAGLLESHDLDLGKWNAEVDWFDLMPLKAGPAMLDRREGTEVIRYHRWRGSQKQRDELIASFRRILFGK